MRKNPLGLGLLLGGAVFAYGLSSGCRTAEILAINDDGEHSSRCLRVPAARYSYPGLQMAVLDAVRGRGSLPQSELCLGRARSHRFFRSHLFCCRCVA